MKIFTILLLILALAASTNAQIKPDFKSLIYVTYENNGTDKAVIRDITEIDATGKAHSRSIYYNGIADTAYQVADAKMTQLNAIFNGNKRIKDYMITTKLGRGERFAGPFDYISVTDKKGFTEEFIIVSIFMSTDFKKTLDRLVILPHKVANNGKEISIPSLSQKIIKAERRANYLPKLEAPPTMME